MATDMVNGTVKSFPDATFSPLFTPSTRVGYSLPSHEEEHLINISIEKKCLTSSEKIKLLHLEPVVPTNPTLFYEQLVNFHNVLCNMFTKDALISTNGFINNYEMNKNIYYSSFEDIKYFTVWVFSTGLISKHNLFFMHVKRQKIWMTLIFQSILLRLNYLKSPNNATLH